MFIDTGPILITVLAGIFLEEGFPRRLFAGCAVALAGVLGRAPPWLASPAAPCLVAVALARG
jgi:hypothetical protein